MSNGSRRTIKLRWTNWLKKGAKEFGKRGVLYMYATQYEPVYIGEAGKQSVRERLKGHEKDGVLNWIKRNIKEEDVKIKVAYLGMPLGINFSLGKLHDIQTLLIFMEAQKRNACRANNANTQTRHISRPGMVVVNSDYYSPLYRSYYDPGII